MSRDISDSLKVLRPILFGCWYDIILAMWEMSALAQKHYFHLGQCTAMHYDYQGKNPLSRSYIGRQKGFGWRRYGAAARGSATPPGSAKVSCMRTKKGNWLVELKSIDLGTKSCDLMTTRGEVISACQHFATWGIAGATWIQFAGLSPATTWNH